MKKASLVMAIVVSTGAVQFIGTTSFAKETQTKKKHVHKAGEQGHKKCDSCKADEKDCSCDHKEDGKHAEGDGHTH